MQGKLCELSWTFLKKEYKVVFIEFAFVYYFGVPRGLTQLQKWQGLVIYEKLYNKV